MQVIDYIKANGLEKLQQEFRIEISDYPDRVVLNYSQIDSPRFHPLVDECRALILRKGTWEVLARSFRRFYNVGEGEAWKQYDVSQARIETKHDGSLMSLYHDGQNWCVSTRKKAFAEGTTTYGRPFNEIFWSVVDPHKFDFFGGTEFTWIFELCGPENRVVTRYEKPQVYLIGGRYNLTGRELSGTELDNTADAVEIPRPDSYQAKSFEEVRALADALPALSEGFVLVWESPDGSHYRLKCKNAAYLAIAHMRDNGVIGPKHILKLIMMNEHLEYLGYFSEDKALFDIVQPDFDAFIANAKAVYEECRGIAVQKDFALAIQAKLQYKSAAGALFKSRKDGSDVEANLRSMDPDKLVDVFGLKAKLVAKLANPSEP